MLFGELISSSFGKAANTYDNAAISHQEIASHLARMIYKSFKNGSIDAPKNTLDIGAGTGVLSEVFSKFFENASITLNDISSEMLFVAKNKFQKNNRHFNFLHKNAEEMDFTGYDMVISNMSMQWFSDINVFIEKSLCYCKKIAFSIPILGTFHNWYDLLDKLNLKISIKYKSKGEILSFCDSLDLSYKNVNEKEYFMKFDSVKAFMKYLKLIGANISDHQYNIDSIRELINIKDPLLVSYKIFFAVLQK